VTSATALLDHLVRAGATLGCAESLTGGLLTSTLVEVPGASAAVRGGIVAYATDVKIGVLGVAEDVVREHGVVSAACAAAMAESIRRVLRADVGLATTGVAGPDPQEGRPVGEVFLGLALGEAVMTRRLQLAGDRGAIRESAVAEAIAWCTRELAGRSDAQVGVGGPR